MSFALAAKVAAKKILILAVTFLRSGCIGTVKPGLACADRDGAFAESIQPATDSFGIDQFREHVAPLSRLRSACALVPLTMRTNEGASCRN
jgi:hypothetical protein